MNASTLYPHLRIRLAVLCFLQFFSWGAWLITLGNYLMNTMGFSGTDVGLVFATAGIASIFMPPLLGYVADHWMRAEQVLGLSLILCGLSLGLLGIIPKGVSLAVIFAVVLLVNLFFMPTLSLCNTVAYSTLKHNGEDVVKVFPPIRIWGTIGFIIAMWTINLLEYMGSPKQFFVAGGVAIVGGIYSFTLPPCKSEGKGEKKKGFLSLLGLDSFTLFRDKKMATFFIFSMLLGCALQLTNAYGNTFLSSFSEISQYSDSFAVKYPNILLSISQISETLFILTIPFFLKRLGIKWVIFISLIAWTLRFGLFGVGNPGFPGVLALILSMVVYGMAFDFFNISGSMFVESEAHPSMRAGAQGLFVLMTNGIGTILGSIGGGFVVDLFDAQAKASQWPHVWFTFAGYTLIVAILFLFLFPSKTKEPKGAVSETK